MPDAIGYIRCSGITQMDKDGPIRQRLAMEKYAKEHGFTVVRWFEEAFTGTDLENRPAYREMREALLSNGVRTVMIEKLDRLARDQMICEFILQDLRKHGIAVISCEPGEEDLQSTNPTRKLIRTIIAAIAEFDRSMLVSRMRAGKNRVRSTGKRCGGRAPYPSPHFPQETEIVNRIHHLRRNGFILSAIVDTLNAEGKRTRKGTYWTTTQVGRILRRAS